MLDSSARANAKVLQLQLVLTRLPQRFNRTDQEAQGLLMRQQILIRDYSCGVKQQIRHTTTTPNRFSLIAIALGLRQAPYLTPRSL
jgi:hypothetical protein